MSTFNAGVGHTVSKKETIKKSTTYISNRLFTLKEVIPDTHGGNTGYLVCLNEKGDTVRVKIAQEDYERNEASLAKRTNVPDEVKFMGHSIDEKMKKALMPPANSKQPPKKVIIEGCYYKTSTKVDGEKINIYEAKRIHNVMNSSPQKLIETPVTISGYYDNNKERYCVSNAQSWDKKAISIEDKKGLESLKEQIDAVVKQEDYKLVPLGVQFRTIIKNKKFDPNSPTNEDGRKEKPYIVIAVSTPFDYISAPQGSDDKGSIIDGDFVINTAKSYGDWANEELLIDFDGQKLTKEDLINEVTFYHNYRCSNKSTSMFFNARQTGSPLYQMMLTKTGTSITPDSDDALRGKNWGGNCFLIISPNKRVDIIDDSYEVTGTEVVYQHFVNQVFDSGYRGNIQSFINAHFETPADTQDFVTNGCSVASGLFRIADNKDVKVTNEVSEDEIEIHNNQDSSSKTQEEEIKSDEIKAVDIHIDDDIPF